MLSKAFACCAIRSYSNNRSVTLVNSNDNLIQCLREGIPRAPAEPWSNVCCVFDKEGKDMKRPVRDNMK